MTAITFTEEAQNMYGMKVLMGTASVTANDNTITISELTTVKHVIATIAGTPATLLATTFSGNVITTTGYTTSTESWRLIIFGV